MFRLFPHFECIFYDCVGIGMCFWTLEIGYKLPMPYDKLDF